MKLKTRKAVSKRIKVTGKKKIKIRSGGQGHFNSRESGKVTKNKRRDKTVSDAITNHVRQQMPHM